MLERKAPGLAAFVVVPAADVAAWDLTATTTIEGTIDGVPLGRRSLHRWDDARWFVELTGPLLRAIGKDVGDRATITFAPASTELPAELAALIAVEPAADARWKALTSAQQRMLREEVRAAKSAATRERRARKALLPEPAPAPAVVGVGGSVLLRIVATDLPGTSCGPYTDVRVGLPTKAGCDPAETVPADVREARWETRIVVLEKDGQPHFRGPAVNGPPGERFVYLTWIGRLDGGPPAMFRRAKLRLDAVPAGVLAAAVRSAVLVGRLGLTAGDGMPLCASVRPPIVTWSAG